MANAPSSPFTAAGLLRICTEFLVRRPSPHRMLTFGQFIISAFAPGHNKKRSFLISIMSKLPIMQSFICAQCRICHVWKNSWHKTAFFIHNIVYSERAQLNRKSCKTLRKGGYHSDQYYFWACPHRRHGQEYDFLLQMIDSR